MRHCENAQCPNRLRHGVQPEYIDAIVDCPECGDPLVPGPSESLAGSSRPPGGRLIPARFSFSFRLVGLLCIGWLTTAVFPVLTLWLALPASPSEFATRPYTLLTYWLATSSVEDFASAAMGLVVYGAVLQPRTSRSELMRLSALSVVVGGLLYVALPASGFLVGSLPIGAGFAGATLRTWLARRRDFSWWEHLVAAYAALGTTLVALAVVASPTNLLAVGTVVGGFAYAHLSLRRSAA